MLYKELKKFLVVFGVAFVSFLFVSSATAVPVNNSRPIMEKINQLEKFEDSFILGSIDMCFDEEVLAFIKVVLFILSIIGLFYSLEGLYIGSVLYYYLVLMFAIAQINYESFQLFNEFYKIILLYLSFGMMLFLMHVFLIYDYLFMDKILTYLEAFTRAYEIMNNFVDFILIGN